MSAPTPCLQPDPNRVQHLPLSMIRPAKENDRIYRPAAHMDAAMRKLVASIKRFGILQPLIVTSDGYIIAGHRRYAAARAAGCTTVRCIVIAFDSRRDGQRMFVELICQANLQRDKTFDEKLREGVVAATADTAYQALCARRKARARIKPPALELGGLRLRSEISPAKAPFLAAVQAVLKELEPFWPVSDRQVHYKLLNNPPLKHASKPGSVYRNDPESYKALVDLLTRARLAGEIPFEAIADETRPVEIWTVYRDVQDYISEELTDLLLGYRRDLQLSQPNHIELLVEKNTVRPIIAPIAEEFCIPQTSGWGYCSLPPRHALAERFFASGKDNLIVLILSDFDPDGETIASSFARSLRDDFAIKNVHAIKVALTSQQVERLQLPPVMTAKAGSATRAAFVEQHGEAVYELEAIPPEDLQALTREAIESVLDVEAFNQEIDQEKADSEALAKRRDQILKVLGQ